MITIKFYRTNEAYGCFSNFSKHPIVINGKEWPTTEHYFQAQKFANTSHEEELRLAKSAMEVAQMGRDRSRPLRKDWETIKDQIMIEAIKAKINQHKDVFEILMSTGNSTLIEHTKNDSYWADAGDGTGLNKLGKIFMDIRNESPNFTPEFYEPLWIKYPGVERSDMFWRMGGGEGYLITLSRWFHNLDSSAQKEWIKFYPCPKEWEDII